MSKSIIVFCPNPYSLYTNSVCELLIRKGYTIDTIIVREFSIERFFHEFARDGKRLLRKIWTKLVLRDKAYNASADNIATFRTKHNLTVKHIKEFKINIVKCHTLNDKVVEDTLKKFPEKLIIFTGGGIIRQNILDLAGDGIINCHMGVLPRYKGMDLPEWCILENAPEELGITLHFMDKGIDTGQILKVVKIPLGESTHIKELRQKFEPIMVQAMVETADQYLQQKLTPIPQPAEQRQYFIVHPRLYEIIDKNIPNLKLS